LVRVDDSWFESCWKQIFLVEITNNLHWLYHSFFFYKLAPTCFCSSLSSSGSFLDPSELLELQMEWVVYQKHITDKRIIMYKILRTS
jgi:hypothetical protein